jgi:hypothetical protein
MPTAYAPTTKNLALAADNAESRSRKSSFTVLRLAQGEEFFTEFPNDTGSLLEWDSKPEFSIGFGHLACGEATRTAIAKYLHAPVCAGSATRFRGRHRYSVPHYAVRANRVVAQRQLRKHPQSSCVLPSNTARVAPIALA